MTGPFNEVDSDVLAFFRAFERASNGEDPGATERQFAEVFMNADPNGAGPIPRSLLVASLPQRRKLFASIGLRRTTLQSIAQTVLDAQHLLVKTDWMAELEVGDGLALSSTFLLRRQGRELQIILYLNHLDILSAIRARGTQPTP